MSEVIGRHPHVGRRTVCLIVGGILLAVPTGFRTTVGMASGWEAELVRFAGMFALVDALAIPAGRGLDRTERRLAVAERAALVVGVLYVVSGDVLALFVAFLTIASVAVNRLVRALFFWYERVRGDVEPREES